MSRAAFCHCPSSELGHSQDGFSRRFMVPRLLNLLSQNLSLVATSLLPPSRSVCLSSQIGVAAVDPPLASGGRPSPHHPPPLSPLGSAIWRSSAIRRFRSWGDEDEIDRLRPVAGPLRSGEPPRISHTRDGGAVSLRNHFAWLVSSAARPRHPHS
jgi:hypothetical protein